MAFDRVIGHERQRQRLMEAVKQDRLAHGYLFCGPPGVGAEALAIELACAVNCEYGPGEPCSPPGQQGPCRHCRRIRALQHPDVHLLVPTSSAPPPDRSSGRGEGSSGRGEGTSGRANAREERRQGLAARLAEDPYGAPPFGMNDLLSVEDVRSLRREASAKPYEGRRKVAVIVAADRMNAAASNALLKTLEEPPGSLMLILTASRSGRLLPTIVSRCQPVFLTRLQEDEVKSALIERYDVSPEEAGELARRSEGRLSEALTAGSERGSKIREEAFALLECIYDEAPLSLFEQVESLAASHREEPVVEKILDHLLSLYRDLFVLSSANGSPSLSNADRTAPLRERASAMNAEEIERGIAAVEEARRDIARNAHVQLALLVLVLRLRMNRRYEGPRQRPTTEVPSRERPSGGSSSHALPAAD
ncbi:MAG: hypothetical protein OXH56_15530 [Gemmatimonadetes bacterium]|nr:hypothetical protein [Gemmatimonadota bacterium]